MAAPSRLPPDHQALVDEALAELGVRRLLLAIQDASFPSDPGEDVGRGSPYTAAAGRFAAFARALGFTGIQLGPQGQTSADNASPYDGTIFSRNVVSVPVATFARGGAYEGLVDESVLAASVVGGASHDGRATHRAAHARTHGLVERAFAALEAGARPELQDRIDRFRAEHASWLERDALYDALRTAHGDKGFRDWPEHGGRSFWDPNQGAERRAALLEEHARSIRRYAFGQMVVHDAHARLREQASALGLAVYADLQIGTSDADAWSYARCFLESYVMGAPPSRTNPEGQPWGYGVLDPAQYVGGADGEGKQLFVARVEKAFAEYDSLRIDHPHGLVCPWVYPARSNDPMEAVVAGARIFESPDLPDHPELARFAVVRPEQIDRTVPRFADEWVTDLEPEQVERYAVFFDLLVTAAEQHARAPSSLACEVLSTSPLPLRDVLDRHGLGRFRVTQKANLDDPTDGYRSENAETPDWAMLGNHDTPPVFQLVHAWSEERRGKWATHLRERLSLDAAAERAIAAEPRVLAQTMLAELFACPAENVSIFFGDLFGYDRSFNVPGLVSDENWSLRLPADFEDLYLGRLAERAALDIPLALAIALEARRPTSETARALAARLRVLASALAGVTSARA